MLDTAPVGKDEAGGADDAGVGADAVVASSALPKKAALGSRWTKCQAEVTD